MKMTVSRPELTKADIQRCHDLIDEMVGLHRETNPELGQVSTKDKYEKSYLALNKIGEIGGILTEWAECQLFGMGYKLAKSDDGWVDGQSCNQHDNELMWYEAELPEDFLSTEKYTLTERKIIAEILHNTFSRYGRMGWRLSLESSLYALNEGQVDELLAPASVRQQGDAFEIQTIQWAAIRHVYKLIGEGWKKTAAQQKLAEACGVTFEAIKKWEKTCIKERDREKSQLSWITKAAIYVSITRTESGMTDQAILKEAIGWNINADKAGDTEGHLKSLSHAIITVLRLDEEFPLREMKNRLAQAGMRKNSGTK